MSTVLTEVRTDGVAAMEGPGPKPVVHYPKNRYNDLACGGYIPEERQQGKSHGAWKFEVRRDGWTKAPHIATMPERRASHGDPETWRTFSQAVSAWLNRNRNG